ncbi:hypothetical protein [Streptomyces sp. TLI_185]|uniref:hypothetical protein n=1 Tax=Streptomyces sp. TLI_185 TaxID=2485151 RepID=UPI000F4DF9D1|nr:hypothetical protein [Streptomyces sp. TLI_185]RPF30306.1 hypothetical protein EDD92_0056 [Streptomyces sp. TLI_185]
MEPLALAMGTALVSAMATDAWQQARSALTTLWRRVQPEQAEQIDADYTTARDRLLSAVEAGADGIAPALRTDWQFRIHLMLHEHPEIAGEVRRVLEAELAPLLPREDQARVGTVMNATASGSGRVYQAGRDQQITER